MKLLLVALLLLAACSNEDKCTGTVDDVGRCCTVLTGSATALPSSASSPSSVSVALDPAFACNALACASSGGTAAYCTQECSCGSDCPEGFTCTLTGGADSKAYCMRVAHVCTP